MLLGALEEEVAAYATVFFLLVHFGVPKPEAVSATVLIRVTTLWFAVPVGLGSAG